MGSEHEVDFRDEVERAYVSADRLQLHAVLSAAFGSVVIVSVLGSMLVGWLSAWDGVAALALAIIVALVPAASFHSDGHRTALQAARFERGLALDEDLYDVSAARRQRFRTFGVVGVAIAAVAAAGIIAYSVANIDTDDDDDDDTEEVEDDNPGSEGSDDDSGGDDG